MRYDGNLGSGKVQYPKNWKIFIILLFSHHLNVYVRNNDIVEKNNNIF